MKRTILSVAYPLTHVGVDAVGGSEQILTLLDGAVTRAGHRSLVIAAEGSRVEGTLIPSPGPKGRINDETRDAASRAHEQLIQDVLARHKVDLVHLHALDFHRYLPGGDVPVLATLHLPPDWYPASIFRIRRENFWMNCVSASQQRACPPCAHLLKPVPNGVDVEALGGSIRKRGFALSMGRVCPEKGFHLALDAAREAGIELRLAGKVFPYASHQQYFREEVLPRLDKLRRFVGPLRFRAKRRLLAQAKCLVIPSEVAETSSLVAMEALACGTPVIAFRSGALPEIIEDGRTGFVVSSVAEMTRALLDVDRLDPEVCRAVARARFSSNTMGARYLALYEELIERTSLAGAAQAQAIQGQALHSNAAA